jgi:hypothetical protein
MGSRPISPIRVRPKAPTTRPKVSLTSGDPPARQRAGRPEAGAVDGEQAVHLPASEIPCWQSGSGAIGSGVGAHWPDRGAPDAREQPGFGDGGKVPTGARPTSAAVQTFAAAANSPSFATSVGSDGEAGVARAERCRPGGLRAKKPRMCGASPMRPRRLELPRTNRSTRPSTLRVYQFRHRRGAVSIAARAGAAALSARPARGAQWLSAPS